MTALVVDAGGTSTRSLVVSQDGACLGYGRGGSGNPVSAGLDVATISVVESARQALAGARIAPAEIDTWLVAMAGGVADDDVEAFAAPMRAMGVMAAPVFRGDALAAFFSGTWQQNGYALVVGTGAIAARIEAGALAKTVDGLGWLLGDEGSGFWIGHRVVRAVLADLDRRGPTTSLTPALLATLSGIVPSGRMLDGGRNALIGVVLETLYGRRPVELARFAPLAFHDPADPVAAAIVSEAVDVLANTLRSVTTADVTGPLVCSGGVLAHNPDVARRIAAVVEEPGRQFVVVDDGLAGAAQLALRLRGPVDERTFQRIRTTLAQVVK